MCLPRPAGRLVPATLLFGLAVHWRLYPIIYALPLLRHFALEQAATAGAAGTKAAAIAADSDSSAEGMAGSRRSRRRSGAAAAWLPAVAGQLLSLRGFAFGALSGALFLALAAVCYRLYGWPFLHETYLYHAARTDPRHNFSPYFYPAYLASAGGRAAAWDVGW